MVCSAVSHPETAPITAWVPHSTKPRTRACEQALLASAMLPGRP
ncbi:hypothetical protein ADIAG_01088 [Paeniglutamicibacter gangotriensis Lz1y]|uniref:Uncharacterized protein n=1 Tax=Paeniglutamicibacter gangotriensis Lz1y TaxID=1276920 RepID=M7NDS7_9MICC|nr:hypothetical protein ADIAG_01088 [Paeniglutamicibacter gangotriensis Lz1y]